MEMTDIKIVHNKLLGGWFIVRGPHQTPLGGRFDTKAAALAHLNRNRETARTTRFNPVVWAQNNRGE
jgi:hypothetical protein